MPDESTPGYHESQPNENPKPLISDWLWPIIVGAAYLAVGAYILLRSVAENPTERTKVLVPAAFNLLLLGAILFQAFIYYRQWSQMKRQAGIMGDTLRISNRAYVGVHNIETEDTPKQRIVIKVGNIGHVPADDVMISGYEVFNPPDITGGLMRPMHSASHKTTFVKFERPYERTKLPPGKLEIKVYLPIRNHFPKEKLPLIFDGDVPLIVQVKVMYGDGFDFKEVSEVAFLYEAKSLESKHGGWRMHPLLSTRDMGEEEASQQPEDGDNPDQSNPTPN